MPSVVTSVIGGIQGASAAHNAAAAAKAGYDQAGATMTSAKNDANSTIGAAVNPAAANIVGASQAAGDTEMAYGDQGAADAKSTAATGAKAVTDAGAAAGAGVSTYANNGAAASDKASTIADSMSQPYTAEQMMQEDPGYAFRLQQGQLALSRSQAAAGASLGGSAAKALASYTQNDASNEYAAAFQRNLTQQQTAFSDQSALANAGEQASEYAGSAGIQTAETAAAANTQAAEYGGTLQEGAATTAGNQQLQGSEAAGAMQVQGAEAQGANDMTTGQYVGQTQIGAGQATAAGDMGAANSWNGMLSGIGSAADSAVAGGVGGDAGFSLKGAITGIPQYDEYDPSNMGGYTLPPATPYQGGYNTTVA
jgi:hypothetical protein